MKNLILSILIGIIFVFGCVGIIQSNNKKDENKNLTKITVAEVTHSLFYTPWYVALENGYFEDEGLEIDVVLTPGADKVASAVLSKDVNIGFAGLEATMYVYNNKEKDYLVNFAGLTKRDGQFIVGPCDSEFDINKLKGKSVLAGRKGGMPLMNFVYALKENNVDMSKIEINTSVEFAGLSGAYISGEGEYVNLFEPNATNMENEGYGCVLESIGKLAGEVPYTVFFTRKSYLENNKDIIEKFNHAINKGIEFTQNNDSKTIAKVVKKQFSDNSIEEISTIIDRYKNADSWWNNTKIHEEAYNRLVDLMKYSDALTSTPPFNKLVNNDFNK